MGYLKLFLGFGLGWATVAALGFAVGAKGTHDDTAQGFQSRINALKQRVAYLEQQAKSGQLTRKAVAPFEVDNRGGQRIFYVSPDRDVELYQGGRRVASMSAGDIGTLWASNGSQVARLWPRGFDLIENEQPSIDLGKDSKEGNYRLIFNNGGKMIASIGVSHVSNAGIALVADGSGSQKADIACPYDYGVVEVERGEGFTVARLTESNGGYFIACSSLGCNPPAVEAGDGGGYGVVRTGPLFYNQGPTGAPGSFLTGKKP